MSDALPTDLRAKLDDLLQRKPAMRGTVDALLARHAAGPEQERARVEKLLRGLVTPSRGGSGRWAVVILLGVAAFVGWQMWAQHEHEAALARSVPATARVTRTDPGDCGLIPRKRRCVRLELEVYRDGAAPYTGTLTDDLELEWMSRVQPGAWLKVGVNPDDAAEILLNEAALAEPPPAPPTGAQ